MSRALLIGDIGGTNARFAMAGEDTAGIEHESILECADYAAPADAIRNYLDTNELPDPEAICLAAAGPIVDGHVRFTNNPWSVTADDLQRTFSIDSVTLLNDFEAIAYAVPQLGKDELMTIGLPEAGPPGDGKYTVGIIGPGTGLGAVGLKSDGERFTVLPSRNGPCRLRTRDAGAARHPEYPARALRSRIERTPGVGPGRRKHLPGTRAAARRKPGPSVPPHRYSKRASNMKTRGPPRR